MEVREAFCTGQFDWAECQAQAAGSIQEANVRLMRQHAVQRFGGALASADEGDSPPDADPHR